MCFGILIKLANEMMFLIDQMHIEFKNKAEDMQKEQIRTHHEIKEVKQLLSELIRSKRKPDRGSMFH